MSDVRLEKAFPLRWDTPTHHPDKRTLDWEGGRYLVQREEKGSRVFRAFINGQRTAYSGTQEECMKSCERAVAQHRLAQQQSPAQPGDVPTSSQVWHGVTVYHHTNRTRFGVAGPHLQDGKVVVTWGKRQNSEEKWCDLRVAPPMPMKLVRVQGGVECYAPDYDVPGVKQRVEAEVEYATDPKERR